MKKWGLLFHVNTGTFRKPKLPLPCCSITPFFNYLKKLVVGMGKAILVYSGKRILKLPVRLSFQCLPSFLGIEKSLKPPSF